MSDILRYNQRTKDPYIGLLVINEDPFAPIPQSIKKVKMNKTAENNIINRNPIDQLLHDKTTENFRRDQDKFQDYPIQFTDEDGGIRHGYLQDAIVTTNKDELFQHYKLAMIIISDGEVFTITKQCYAAVECDIDWGTIQCTTKII